MKFSVSRNTSKAAARRADMLVENHRRKEEL